ncbi:MAG TPA: hypothetical protein VH877_04480 [Polyangia bacterium]|nr:hypothetical protein [Polyangia bacterium]
MNRGIHWCLFGLMALWAGAVSCGGAGESPVDERGQPLEARAASLPPGCHADCPPCPPGQICPAIACKIVCAPGHCATDSDCRLESNYCGGCNCEALTQDQRGTTCPPNDIVNCFADPCLNKAAACDQATGRCVVVPAPPPSP